MAHQNGHELVLAIRDYLFEQFEARGTGNQLSVSVGKIVNPWRGNPRDKFYQAAERAIHDVWAQDPLYIQEGGTFNNCLAQILPGVPTLHLPLGQASDRAHLSNEVCLVHKWGVRPVGGRAVLKTRNFFFLVEDSPEGHHQPPTAANRQPPTANRRQPPTANRCSTLLLGPCVLPMP